MINDAAIEYMRSALGGSKQKQTVTVTQEQLPKACRCRLTAPLGQRKDKRPFHHDIITQKMRRKVAESSSMVQGKQPTNSLAEKHEKALEYLFGAGMPMPPVSSTLGRSVASSIGRSRASSPKPSSSRGRGLDGNLFENCRGFERRVVNVVVNGLRIARCASGPKCEPGARLQMSFVRDF